MFTAQQVRDILRLYGEFPKPQPGFNDPQEFRYPERNDFFIFPGQRENVQQALERLHGCYLIYTPKVKKYRFICDDPTPRRAEEGDWIVDNKDGSWPEKNPWPFGYQFVQPPSPGGTHDKYLIFRREEITD